MSANQIVLDWPEAYVTGLVPVGIPSFPGLRILLPGDASRSCWKSSSLVRSASSVPFKEDPGHAGRGPRDEDPQTGTDEPLRVRRPRLRRTEFGPQGPAVACSLPGATIPWPDRYVRNRQQIVE